MKKFIYLIAVLSLLLNFTMEAKEKGNSGKKDKGKEEKQKDKDQKDDKSEENKKNSWLNAEITQAEKDVVCDYIKLWEGKGDDNKNEKKKKSLPPGLAKKVANGGELPPGWQKKVACGEVLPLEVYKQAQPLPKEITVKLPKPPPGTVLVAVDGKIVRLAEATRTICDVFDPAGNK